MPNDLRISSRSKVSSNPMATINATLRAERAKVATHLAGLDELLALADAITQQGLATSNLPPVTPGEFRGMRISNALEPYIRLRRGHRIPFKRIVDDLLEGEVNPGAPRGRKTDPRTLIAQTLKITLPNRTNLVDWEPKGSLMGIDEDLITVWLASTADEPEAPARPRSKKSK